MDTKGEKSTDTNGGEGWREDSNATNASAQKEKKKRRKKKQWGRGGEGATPPFITTETEKHKSQRKIYCHKELSQGPEEWSGNIIQRRGNEEE